MARPARKVHRVLLIDNFDSFTHVLASTLGGLGAEVVVRRNRASVRELLALRPGGVLLSPGPGRPEESGCSLAALRAFAGQVPVLGVCLGHQLLARAYGARVIRAATPVHGRADRIHHRDEGLLQGLPNPFPAARYHSLVVERESLPPALEITAWTAGGEVMGLRHRTLPLQGIQFHPESVLSPVGPALLKGFLHSLTASSAR